jgi:hypothetical protein
MAAARDILSPYTSAVEKVAIIDRNGVTHILVNDDLPEGLILKYWTLNPYVAERTLRLFARMPPVFAPVASSGGLKLYEWTGTIPGDGSYNPPIVGKPPARATEVGEWAGEAILAAAHVTKTVEIGQVLIVELFWSRETPAPPGTYVVSLRLDYVGLELPLGGKPFDKVARKVKEQLEGRLYRLRDDHIIQDGFFGPDRWPTGYLVYDSAEFTVPKSLAPGTYTVQAKLLRVAAMPNTDLRSYLFDDDMYSGVEIGRIEITE